ncbi:RNA-directed DNA polymerase, eukaryota [Tanacetum coccineum]
MASTSMKGSLVAVGHDYDGVVGIEGDDGGGGIGLGKILGDMLLKISQVYLNAVDDHCVWTMAKDDIFSVGESRRIIDSKLLPSLVPSTSWDKTLPRKVNIFIWRLDLDWLPHRWNLSARGIDIPLISCPSCKGNVESSYYILFECDSAKKVWKLVRNWCDISIPLFSSFELWKAWFDSWHTSKEKSHHISIIAASSFCWIWRYRNSVIFGSHPKRKSGIFDYIRSSSFSWLVHRG